MKKNYVLDSNVLLHDPHAVFKFEDNNVIIPIYALEEVDKFKRESTERGRNARTIARVLDDLRERGGTLSKPVPIKHGGTLCIALPLKRPELPVGLAKDSIDHAILQTAIDFRDQDGGLPTVFVTMDTNLRIRADAIGVTSQTYENPRVQDFNVEESVVEVLVPKASVEAFFDKGELTLDQDFPELHPNAGVMLRNDQTQNHTGLGRYDSPHNTVRKLRIPREGVMGVRPRNKEQSIAFDLLLDDNVRLVSLLGKAGTGKTLLALAAGLQRTTVDRSYSRLLVSRPIMPLGRDLGFLPGDVDEKLNPWMQPIFDNLELIFSGASRERDSRSYAPLLESGVIQVEPLTYIRGRSLPNQYLIVDEAQNLTPHEVKTIITRSGEGTKVVLTGDPHQIDNPYVDQLSNGLSVVAQRFKGEPIAGHVAMNKGERSELAELATNLL